jgi:hypothetical protein
MELAGLEPATSWVRFGRAPRSSNAICRNFGGQPPAWSQSECPRIAGDYREFAPENAASGANTRTEAGVPAGHPRRDFPDPVHEAPVTSASLAIRFLSVRVSRPTVVTGVGRSRQCHSGSGVAVNTPSGS